MFLTLAQATVLRILEITLRWLRTHAAPLAKKKSTWVSISTIMRFLLNDIIGLIIFRPFNFLFFKDSCHIQTAQIPCVGISIGGIGVYRGRLKEPEQNFFDLKSIRFSITLAANGKENN
jgi:hypothetical protein